MKPSPAQHHPDACVVAVSVALLEFRLQRSVTFQSELVAIGIGHLDFERRQLRFHGAQVVEGFQLLLPQAVSAGEFRALRQIGDACVFGDMHLTGGRQVAPGQDINQGGLAAAVGPDQSDARASWNLQADLAEDLFRAIKLAQIGGCEQGHVPFAS